MYLYMIYLLVKFWPLKCCVMYFPGRLSISLGLFATPPPPQRPHNRVAPWHNIQCQTPCLPKLEPLPLMCVHVNSFAIHPTGTRDTERPCLLLYVVCVMTKCQIVDFAIDFRFIECRKPPNSVKQNMKHIYENAGKISTPKIVEIYENPTCLRKP